MLIRLRAAFSKLSGNFERTFSGHLASSSIRIAIGVRCVCTNQLDGIDKVTTKQTGGETMRSKGTAVRLNSVRWRAQPRRPCEVADVVGLIDLVETSSHNFRLD